MNNTFDYIIIGAGTAGCLLANRLSQDADKEVLLIEAGGRDTYPWIHIPVGYLYCIGNPRTDWMFQTEADPGLNGRSLKYPRGKTLGGCSSINGMLYIRGQARDYDHWANLCGDPAWCWENALPDFKAHENHYKLDNGEDHDSGKNSRFSDFHGHTGEWRVEKQRLRWDILDAFAQAAIETGIEPIDDFNVGDNAGVCYFEVNQSKGWRWNSSKAFLRPARHRKNLTVWTRTQVKNLIFKTGDDGRPKCDGAVAAIGGQNVTVFARSEVVLSAGAIGTPHILQHSGIGSARKLKSFDIPVRQNLPGVGANLQDHLQIRAVFKIEGAKTLNTMANSLVGKAKMGAEYLLRRTGPMSMAPSQLGAFTRSTPDRAYANLQYHVQPLSLEAFGEDLHPFPAITVSVCNLNPTSKGEVSLRSGNSMDAPVISPNYLSTAEDKAVAADSLRQIRHIIAQPAMQKFNPVEWKPGAQYQTDAELVTLAGDIANTIFHPVGTAKMGQKDDKNAVVDSRLRVFGIDGLRIADASIMPDITSGNTNAPTLMIAEKAAAWIRGGE